MKKVYLLAAAALFGATAVNAATVTNRAVYSPAVAVLSLSPNGQWAAGYNMNVDASGLFNTATGDGWEITNHAGAVKTGMGRTVSDNGLAIFNVQDLDEMFDVVASRVIVVREGVTLTTLPRASWANAISPNGDQIVGEDTQGRACIWHLLDGAGGVAYSQPELVTLPGRDPFGGQPQFTTLMGVNDLGDLIACTTTPESGMLDSAIPGVIRLVDNRWEYDCLSEKAIYNGINRPEPPEFNMPDPKAFIDPDKMQAYLDEMEELGYEPDPEPYMTPENFAAYQQAMADAVEAYEKADEAYLLEMDAFRKATDGLAFFLPNDLAVSADVSHIAAISKAYNPNEEEDNPGGGGGVMPLMPAKAAAPTDGVYTRVYVFETKPEGSFYSIAANVAADPICSFVSNDGKTLVVNQNDIVSNAFITTDAENASLQPVYDWMPTVNEKTFEWMQDNMYYPADMIYPDMPATEMMWNSGYLTASEGLEVLVGSVFNVYPFYEDPETGIDYSNTDYISYVMTAAPAAGLCDIEAAAPAIGHETWFTLQGVKVAAPKAGKLYVKIGADGKAVKTLAR